MKSSIIFYSARKTSLCEKALRKCLPELGLNLSSAVFATKRPALGEALTQAFFTPYEQPLRFCAGAAGLVLRCIIE